jgi:TolA-binding protein
MQIKFSEKICEKEKLIKFICSERLEQELVIKGKNWLMRILSLFILLNIVSPIFAEGLWGYYKKGTEYKEQKKFSKAIEEYRKIIVEYPNSRKVTDAYFQIADCFRKDKKSAKAIEIYQQIITRNAGNEEIISLALFGMGLSYEIDGNMKSSKGIYKKIFYQYPDSAYILYVKDKMGGSKDIQKIEGSRANSLWENANQLYFSILVGKLERIRKADMRERAAKAVEEYKKLIRQYSSGRFTQECRARIGTCFRAIKDYRSAIKEYQAVLLVQKPDDIPAESQFWLGWCEFLIDNYDNAKKEFKEVIKNYPENKKEVASAYFGLGSVHEKIADNEGGEGPYVERYTKEYKKAVEYFEKLTKEFPESVWRFQAEKKLVRIKLMLKTGDFSNCRE